MKAIASLIQEHEVVSRVVDALEIYAHRLECYEPVPAGDVARFAEIFEELGEYIHHEKEETILLPLLSRHGFEWHRGVLDAVQADHRQERYLMDVLFQASQRSGAWSNEHRRHVAASAKALVDFQRRHHELENRELFPEVALRLSESAQRELEAALEAFDADAAHRERRDTAIQHARELVGSYLSDPRAGAEAAAPA